MKEKEIFFNKRSIILSLILIAACGVLTYGNSLKGRFIWDDEYLVKNNRYIRDFSCLPNIFTQDIGAGSGKKVAFFRPLQVVSYMLDHSFWGLDVRGYHLTNLILHILVGICLYFIILRLFKDNILSLLTSLLFLVHPIHSEAVTYISGRADPLAGLFILLCFLFYLRYSDKDNISAYIAMIVSFILALLSREGALILPAFLILYHLSFKKRFKLKAILPFLVLSVIYIIIRIAVLRLPLSDSQTSATTLFARLPGVFVALASYLRLLVLPLDLHMEYGFRLFDLSDPKAVLGFIIMIFLFVAAWRKRSQPLVFFSLGWFFVAFLPYSGIYPLNAYMAEHWIYLSSIGFFLMLARLLRLLLQNKRAKVFAFAASIGLLVFYSSLTIKQNTYWQDPISFYKRTLEYTPESSRVYYNLGNAYKERGEFKDAVLAYRQAIKLDPKDYESYNNLGIAFKDSGRIEEAVTVYRKAIEVNPGHANAYYNLGNAYRAIKDNRQAIAAFKKALELDPSDAQSYNNLGNAYYDLGSYQEAVVLYKKAIDISPEYIESYNNLGAAYYSQGDIPNAVRAFKKALEIDPRDAEARKALESLE